MSLGLTEAIPIRSIFCGCARTASGHAFAAVAPPRSVMNSRRLMGVFLRPGLHPTTSLGEGGGCAAQQNGLSVDRYGSLTDSEPRPRHFRFAPESGHDSNVTRGPLCANGVADY